MFPVCWVVVVVLNLGAGRLGGSGGFGPEPGRFVLQVLQLPQQTLLLQTHPAVRLFAGAARVSGGRRDRQQVGLFILMTC